MTDRLVKIETLPGMGRSIIQHDDRSIGKDGENLPGTGGDKRSCARRRPAPAATSPKPGSKTYAYADDHEQPGYGGHVARVTTWATVNRMFRLSTDCSPALVPDLGHHAGA